MSNKFLLLLVSLTALLFGCVKSTNNSSTSALAPIEAAKAFFKREIVGKTPNTSNYRAKQSKSVNWDQATIKHFPSGDVIVAPVTYAGNLFVSSSDAPAKAYNLNDLTTLIITRDSSNKLHACTVTFIPDTTTSVDPANGIYIVEDWQGNSIFKPVRHRTGSSNENVGGTIGKKQTDIIQTIQVCTEIDGFNYSPDFPDLSYSWSETTCTTFGFSSELGLPSNSLPGLAPTRGTYQIVVNPPPGNPIANITDYFKCFTNGPSPSDSYSVQVCVDQPTDGTRQPWGFTKGGPIGSSSASNFVDAGHVFLVLTENAGGYITTRNIGFYPATMVIPTTTGAFSQGVLNNDQGHTYNISLTINVSGNDFFNILNYLELGNNPGYYYNLNSNNCTTFVINALATGNISLPATKGSWPGGSGYDPGDLGEDIRKMPLSSNMSRNTVENSHLNVGSCN